MTLAGTVAVVTGAGGNLGPVWIAALHDAGATVCAIDVAEIADERLAAVAVADVTDHTAVRAARDRLVADLGAPSVLVNSAGIDQPPVAGARTARVEDVPLGDFRRVLEVNVAGAFNVCQAFGPVMAAERRGSIVNIGSLYASQVPDPHLYDHMDPPFLKPPAYGASKAALVHLTRYLARLWGPSGVRVNALSPGGVAGGQDQEFVRKFSARTALGRLATAEDLVGPLLFLASEESRYVTGQELRVDGGFTA